MSNLRKNTAPNPNGLDILSAGYGYSSDKQQLVTQQCYNVLKTVPEAPKSYGSFGESETFESLENKLSITVDAKGKYGMFSASASASYMRDIQDKEYSLSVNYYGLTSSTVDVQLGGGSPETLLTEQGLSYYNNGTNPYFGVICGDYVVTQYQAGAMLVMSMNLEFESSYEKEQFKAHAKGGFGTIFSASTKIEKTVTSLGLKGDISVQAFQIGGQPEKLSQWLNRDASGDFYVLTCDIQNMGNCTHAASGLLDYASSSFSTQFHFSPPKDIYAIDSKFSSEPVAVYGLNQPHTFVNATVTEARVKLSESLEENQYYQQKLTELQQAYPVEFDTGSDLYKNITSLAARVQENIETLTATGDPMSSSVNCFNMPYQCTEIAQNVLSQVKPVTQEDLNFLDQIKYFYVGAYHCSINGPMASFYESGSGWLNVNNPAAMDQTRSIGYAVFDGNNTKVQLNTVSSGPGGDGRYWTWNFYDAKVSADNKTISVKMNRGEGEQNGCYFVKNSFPLYFTEYDPTSEAGIVGESTSIDAADHSMVA